MDSRRLGRRRAVEREAHVTLHRRTSCFGDRLRQQPSSVSISVCFRFGSHPTSTTTVILILIPWLHIAAAPFAANPAAVSKITHASAGSSDHTIIKMSKIDRVFVN
jgi:hypothetical protein